MIGQRLPMIVRRSLRQHALSTLVTVLSIALGSGLVMSVLAIKTQAVAAFIGGSQGFDAVLGARGSPLQLVLNAVFHLEASPGNLPWQAYLDMKKDARVELAIPYALGDNHQGFRIVGTTSELFTEVELRKGQRFRVLGDGRLFDPQRREAVVGNFVARRLGIGVGSTFQPAHGVVHHGDHVHVEEYVVVGVLAATSTPADRVIWIPIDGVFRMGGHVLRGGGEEYEARPGEAIPDHHKEVSAVMLKFKSPQVGLALDARINREETTATLAWPIGTVMARLFDRIGWMHRILELIAILVMLVAGGTILASLYNALHERRREFAILRALGARRSTVFSVVVLEAVVISGLGVLVGFVVHGLIFAVASTVIRNQVGIVLDPWSFHPSFVLAPVAAVGLGALCGVVPALQAYRTDVARHLTPQ